jgi:hypothetical protein
MTGGGTQSEYGSSQSLPSIVLNLVDMPATAFRTVLAGKGVWMWLAPLLVLVLALGAAMAVQAPYSAELARQQAERQISSMPADQVDAAREQIATFTSTPVILATSLVSGILMVGIGLLAQAAFVHFGALILGAERDFVDSLKVSLWTRIPQALRYAVMAVFTLAAGRQIRYPGLSALVASGDILKDGKNPLVALLGGIDPFWLWHLWLVAVGVSVLGRLTAVYAALSLLLLVLPSLLFGNMGT